ncbi:hypothetical protein BC831DRAFT_471527 [Entophlyctis helioformis]|nr:hypothetical protein BC831DRAFT_471527 [Entophlyctis helioformis]
MEVVAWLGLAWLGLAWNENCRYTLVSPCGKLTGWLSCTQRHCVALFDYTGTTDEELSFAEGDKFAIVNSETPDWCREHADDQDGVNDEQDDGSRYNSSNSNGSGSESDTASESTSASGSEYDSSSSTDDEADDPARDVLRQQRISRRKSRAQLASHHQRKLLAPDALPNADHYQFPRGFCVSTLATNYQAGYGHLSDILTPILDPYGLSFAELSVDHKNKLRATSAKCTVALNHLNVRGRHIRMALFDSTSILSNIHTVSALVTDSDSAWRFSSKASLLFPKDDENTCFLRANSIDIRLSLLFELCLVIDVPDAAGTAAASSSGGGTIEVSCGWGMLPLFSVEGGPMENKTYEIRLHGGNPFQRDVEFDEPLPKKGFLQGLVGQPRPPRLHVRMWKLGKDVMEQLDNLPTVMIGHLAAGAVFSLFRQAQARALVLRANAKEGGLDAVYEPILSLFPKIAEQPDLLQLLVLLWERKVRTLKSSEKRSANKMTRHFRMTVLSLWPMLSFWDMPRYQAGDGVSLKMRQAFIKKLQEVGVVEFLGKNSVAVAYEPFDMSELTVSVS